MLEKLKVDHVAGLCFFLGAHQTLSHFALLGFLRFYVIYLCICFMLFYLFSAPMEMSCQSHSLFIDVLVIVPLALCGHQWTLVFKLK
jgi:hypothetical protein